ncbi:MAG: response regulator [Bacillota bacterium]
MIRVMIAEDQELIRQSLEIILSNKPDIDLIAIAEDGKQTLELAKKYSPDIILMDIRMPHVDGNQCIKILKENSPKIKIIVLTTFDDDEYVFEAIKNGASGYLLKGISSKELVEAIRTVASGGALLNPNVAVKVCQFFSQMAHSDYRIRVNEKAYENLSKIELKIIKLIGIGMSNKEIRDRLKYSEGTVRNYISSILNKLEFRDRTQIAIFAVQSGLLLKKLDD